MTGKQVRHIMDAARAIADSQDLVVVDGQAVPGQLPGAPGGLPGSPFQKEFGYFLHGADETTAILPDGWRGRLFLFEGAWCLEVHDLAIVKYLAGSENDLAFTNALVRGALVSREVLEQRLAATSLPLPLRQMVSGRIHRDFAGLPERLVRHVN